MFVQDSFIRGGGDVVSLFAHRVSFVLRTEAKQGGIVCLFQTWNVSSKEHRHVFLLHNVEMLILLEKEYDNNMLNCIHLDCTVVHVICFSKKVE